MELSNQAKAVIVFVLIVFIASIGSVMFYHNVYTRPVDESIMRLADEGYTMGLENSIRLESTKDILKKQSIINFGFYVMNKKQNADLDLFYLKNKLHDIKIKSLEEKVDKLETRHLEVIRALAILQKRDWPTEKRLESSGISVGSTKYSEPTVNYNTSPEPQVIIENIEKELKEWEK